MTRTLVVMRHGHAANESTGDPPGDRGRPLTEHGREVAHANGQALAHALGSVQLVLCSTATRARQTWAEVARSLTAGRVRELDALYGAGVDGVLDLLAEADDELACVMLVGHNPTFSELVLYLAERGRDGRALSPGDAVVLECDEPTWAERRPGRWRVRARIGS